MNFEEQTYLISQKKELAELFGFETRNKYQITSEDGSPVAYAAEQGKGFLAMVGRLFLGHWRTFEIHIFDTNRNEIFKALHPFRWIFQRLEVSTPQGAKLGALQQRFSLLYKKFDVEDAHGKVFLTVASPFWKIWTFPFMNGADREVARVEKKWSGLLKEMFMDADNFAVKFNDTSLSPEQKKVLIASAIFIDLQYFEKKANNN